MDWNLTLFFSSIQTLLVFPQKRINTIQQWDFQATSQTQNSTNFLVCVLGLLSVTALCAGSLKRKRIHFVGSGHFHFGGIEKCRKFLYKDLSKLNILQLWQVTRTKFQYISWQLGAADRLRNENTDEFIFKPKKFFVFFVVKSLAGLQGWAMVLPLCSDQPSVRDTQQQVQLSHSCWIFMNHADFLT